MPTVLNETLMCFFQYEDIDARLKSLQEDYKTQQDTHCRELEVKATQLTKAESSIVQLEDKIASLQEQLVSTKADMNTMNEQLEAAATVSVICDSVIAIQKLFIVVFKDPLVVVPV